MGEGEGYAHTPLGGVRFIVKISIVLFRTFHAFVCSQNIWRDSCEYIFGHVIEYEHQIKRFASSLWRISS
jgi:hypothetical protein